MPAQRREADMAYEEFLEMLQTSLQRHAERDLNKTDPNSNQQNALTLSQNCTRQIRCLRLWKTSQETRDQQQDRRDERQHQRETRQGERDLAQNKRETELNPRQKRIEDLVARNQTTYQNNQKVLDGITQNQQQATSRKEAAERAEASAEQ